MRLVVSLGVAALATIAIAGADLVSGISTASAQGRVICQYGTAKYKRCCQESFDNNPNMGPRARGRDIDACMSGRERDREKTEEPDRSERRTSRTKDREERRAPPPADAGLRRVDCSADGCNGGCSEDEVVISAFCPSGAPTVNGDRDVRCAEGRERPAVLVCAKR
jgi:hypothetical protein